MKVSIFEHSTPEGLEEAVNAFISSVEVVDIKYQVMHMWMGNWEDTRQSYSALVMYKERTNTAVL